jgi:hypothetical protein
MKTRRMVLGLAGVCFLSSICLAVDPFASSSTAYCLRKGSTYQIGCFDPCECPIYEEVPVVGRFELAPVSFDGLYQVYDVFNVAWKTQKTGQPVEVTGWGTYRVGGEFAAMHQLELDLAMSDGTTNHFDSGLVVGGGSFPAIDIVISIHGMWCYDQVFHVYATPAADINGDGHADVTDLLILAGAWATRTADANYNAACDLNGDGSVDVADLLILADDWD